MEVRPKAHNQITVSSLQLDVREEKIIQLAPTSNSIERPFKGGTGELFMKY